MKKGGLLVFGLASLVAINLSASELKADADCVYEKRCANCHGATANGVPKLTEREGVKPDAASAAGVSSQEKKNIYGPPLNHLSKEQLLSKLTNLRNKDFDASSPHSVMRDTLKNVEKREGEISDEEMAEYIYETFGTAD